LGILCLAPFLVVSTACTSSSGSADAQPSGQAVTTSPTPPPPPPKPRTAAKARFEGTYAVTFILLSSKISQKGKPDKTTWNVRATCKTGGECDAVIAWNDGAHSRAGYLAGQYRFSETIQKSYTCGSGGHVDYSMAGVYNYSLTMTDMALINDEWVATTFQGKYDGVATRGCGFSPAGVWETWSMTGHIVR